jgi:hypothetical protein
LGAFVASRGDGLAGSRGVGLFVEFEFGDAASEISRAVAGAFATVRCI